MISDIKSSASLGHYQGLMERAMADLRQNRTMARIWARDYTVWKTSPTEIANRLGWLESPGLMADHLQDMTALTESVRRDGYTQALLLGMGGSSLAPEVFRKTFGVADGYLDLGILDSTVPGAILAWSRTLDPAKTLFIISTKSGGTIETVSFMTYFYNWIAAALGAKEAGRHFIAITDPGSGLAEMALNLHFRHIFYNDPDIGGRYSALSFFGLSPAALMGMDIKELLQRAAAMAAREQTDADESNAAFLGTILGELAKAGRDKLTLTFSKENEAFGDWIEQLVAESIGKEGKGIVPVVGEPLGPPEVYGQDRIFVDIRLAGDRAADERFERLKQAGHPVIQIKLEDQYDIGGQCFLWELATAVAGSRLGVNPFDQPDVEAAKVCARQIMSQYMDQGGLPEERPDYEEGPVAVYGKIQGHDLKEIVTCFLAGGVAGSYVAIQAYVQPTTVMDEALRRIRLSIRDRYHLATTVGYGPRFLHSTGQLHKGDGGQGLFLQITTDAREDAPIPDKAGEPNSQLTFGALNAAQALGDRQALMKAGRQVMRLHIKDNIGGRLTAVIL